MRLKMKYKMKINGSIMNTSQIMSRKLLRIIQNKIRVFNNLNSHNRNHNKV